MPTVSAHVAAALSRHVDQVFGLMGNGNAYFLDALLRDTGAVYTAVRHEAGAVVAADAHFRVSGRIAAATTTYGAGFTNALTALAESAQARVPLVLVVGDQPTPGPRPWDVDQIALASAVGVRTYTVGRPDAAATTVIAIEHALANRTPVVLALPYDTPALEAGAVPELREPRLPQPVRPSTDARAAVDRAADALAAAARPVLIAGRGAWLAGAGDALGRLADAAGAVTATTALGRGVFPDEAHDLGVTGGFGAPGAMDLVRSADVVVAIGASLSPFTMRFGELLDPTARLIQVDVAATATHPRVGEYIRGDARLVADMLADAVAARRPSLGGWRDEHDLAALRRQDAGAELAPDGRLDPRAAAALIGRLLPQDRVVVSDGGHFIGWANMFWDVASPGRMVMVGTAFQSIGLGWPSVAGAAQAAPDATIVLTTGDGGGLMALADLETAIRAAGGRGLAVVWNDAAYGAEVNLYGLKGLHEAPMRIPQVDFAALGRAAGAEGVVVERLSDLDRLATWAAEPPADRPFLVLDLRVSGTVLAPYQHEVIRVNA
ncbi:thiamine pyrophosphate-binding protein [Microbacterium marinilacus]|uniref:Thiamine pyrophosphate-binding protein n=1 Tax=Microbacterium marinilacus TaxID=415209 RepID=A0ABP7BAS4_9MICO|nr:thiamine pyrophosphate-binding protein [Microbacterium marinilacus]MBY0687143.1 thiamine pyrophosphate-binding protein [Microbacterium marinilacus]